MGQIVIVRCHNLMHSHAAVTTPVDIRVHGKVTTSCNITTTTTTTSTTTTTTTARELDVFMGTIETFLTNCSEVSILYGIKTPVVRIFACLPSTQ